MGMLSVVLLLAVSASAAANPSTDQHFSEKKGAAAPPETVEQRRARALCAAAARGQVGKVQAFIDTGADLNAHEGEMQGAALHWAVVKSEVATVRLLLKAGARHDIRDKAGTRPLDLAKNAEIKAVLTEYAEADCVKRGFASCAAEGEEVGKTAKLFKLAKDGSAKEVKHWLRTKQLDVDARDEHNRTALHISAQAGNLVVLKALLKLKAATEVRNAYFGTPLQSASINGHAECAKALLANGADARAHDRDGGTALHFAADQDHKAVMLALLEGGAPLDAVDREGRAPFHVCRTKEGKQMIIDEAKKRQARGEL